MYINLLHSRGTNFATVFRLRLSRYLFPAYDMLPVHHAIHYSAFVFVAFNLLTYDLSKLVEETRVRSEFMLTEVTISSCSLGSANRLNAFVSSINNSHSWMLPAVQIELFCLNQLNVSPDHRNTSGKGSGCP